MEDPNFDRVVEGAEVLPYRVCDAVAAKDEQESLAEDTRESKGDVPKEDICGSAEVMSSVKDVGDKGVGGVEGLPTRLAGSLGGGEEVALVDFALEFEEEALLPDHAEDIAKGNSPVVDGCMGSRGGTFPDLYRGVRR